MNVDLKLPDLTVQPTNPTPAAPHPLGASRTTIDRLATDLAQRLGYQAGASLVPVLEALGIVRRVSPWGFGSTSNVLMDVLGPYAQLLVDPDTGPLHQRFQIARALGHWLLHHQIPLQRDGTCPPWLRVDRYDVDEQALSEANRFAFAFLMPEAAVHQVALACGHDVLRVAEHFQVAPRIANLRMKGLGLLREGTNPEAPGAAAAVIVPPVCTNTASVGESFQGLPSMPVGTIPPRPGHHD